MPVTARKGLTVRSLLAACLTVVAIVVGVAPPAHAGWLTAECSTRKYAIVPMTLNASAYYYTTGQDEHTWTDYTYRLDGGGTGGKSNMLIYWYSGPAIVGGWGSPDDRASGVTYGLYRPVTTYGWDDPHDEAVSFTAIFDVAGPDPECTAWTPAL